MTYLDLFYRYIASELGCPRFDRLLDEYVREHRADHHQTVIRLALDGRAFALDGIEPRA